MDLKALKTGGGVGQPKEKRENKWISRAKNRGGGSGSVAECLTRDRRAAGSSLTGVTALWSLSKRHLS